MTRILIQYKTRVCICIFSLFTQVVPQTASAATDTWTETDQYIYTTNSNKYVGIGTTTPGAALTVNSSAFLLGGTTIDGIYEPEDRVFEIQAYDGSAYLNLKGKNGNFVLASTDYGEGSNGFYSSQMMTSSPTITVRPKKKLS